MKSVLFSLSSGVKTKGCNWLVFIYQRVDVKVSFYPWRISRSWIFGGLKSSNNGGFWSFSVRGQSFVVQWVLLHLESREKFSRVLNFPGKFDS